MRRELSVGEILSISCERIGVSPAEAMSRSTRRCVMARAMTVVIARQMLKRYSYLDLARAMKRNYTTIIETRQRLLRDIQHAKPILWPDPRGARSTDELFHDILREVQRAATKELN